LFNPQIIYEHGEPRWNDVDRETEELRENLSQCHFVHHKTHMHYEVANQDLRDERPATNRLSHVMAL
jgi:hypothetical protein